MHQAYACGSPSHLFVHSVCDCACPFPAAALQMDELSRMAAVRWSTGWSMMPQQQRS